MKVIKRKCSVCGFEIKVKLKDNNEIIGANYFGKYKIPIEGTGEYVKVGTSDILGADPVDVIDWTGKEEEVECWECDKCFNGGKKND